MPVLSEHQQVKRSYGGCKDMDEILDLNINEMTEVSFDCNCGRKHTVDLKKIVIGRNVLQQIPVIISSFKSGRIFVMADNNTYGVCGKNIEELLLGAKFNFKTFVFQTEAPLVPDERAVGRLLIEIEKGTSAILAIGSGSLNDLARTMSCKLGIPYVIAGTAPSMDGYASVVSPLIIDGFKTTFNGVYPYAIVADIDIMKEAPMDMINAGFGDVLGKLTALADWELSQKLNGEYYCETSVRLVKNAIKKCTDNAEGMRKREVDAIRYLIEALVLTGVAMGLTGTSRPASGAEHHLAHFWEMEALAKGEQHPLHGNSVGVGTVVISSVYEQVASRIPMKVQFPKPDYVIELLGKAGSCSNPAVLGISRELFKRSVLHAMEIRDRYTILSLAASKGLLEEIAEILTGRFYE
jgi:glycerol-1-phosphate dehydrogenase [NAD(P)+]